MLFLCGCNNLSLWTDNLQGLQYSKELHQYTDVPYQMSTLRGSLTDNASSWQMFSPLVPKMLLRVSDLGVSGLAGPEEKISRRELVTITNLGQPFQYDTDELCHS